MSPPIGYRTESTAIGGRGEAWQRQHAYPEEDGVGEVDGEVGEDLVHLLGRVAPCSPEVHGGGPGAGHRGIELRLRPHLPHRPAARHRLRGLQHHHPSSRDETGRRDARVEETAAVEVAAWGFPLLLRPRERSIDRIDPGGSSRGQSWDLGAARSEPEPDGLFFFFLVRLSRAAMSRRPAEGDGTFEKGARGGKRRAAGAGARFGDARGPVRRDPGQPEKHTRESPRW